MRIKGFPAISYSLMLLWLLLLSRSLSVARAGEQMKSPQATSNAAVRKRIASIIAETLREGEGVVDGVKVCRIVPPAKKNIEEIRRYGEEAVKPLTNHLKAESERERAIVVEFLRLLGGRRIVTPLQRVIQSDGSPSIRILALRWITQAPFNLVSPIIREAARTDPDQRVREEAQNLLRPSRSHDQY
jgi:hypothetical protein